MISIKNLSVSFGKKVILNDVNIEIFNGDRVAIIGRNGSGKTTFIETIMGLNHHSKGSINISSDLKIKMKTVFQDIDYDSELTLSELIYFYSKLANRKEGFSKNHLDVNVLNKYDLFHLKNKKFRHLSGGEKQKFKLLLCMEFEPELVILDELTTSLDYQWRSDITKNIKDYFDKHQNGILILVSHDPNEIKLLCNKYFLVNNQKISQIENIDLFFGVN